MKKVLVMTSLVFSSVLHSIAVDAGISGEGKTSATNNKEATTSRKTLSVQDRANHLTDQMIKDLRLNNYQSNRLRAINLELVNKIAAIEANGGDPKQVEMDCKGACSDRDKILEDVLSTDQYSKYFSNRPNYFNYDKQYAMGGYLEKPTAKVTRPSIDEDDDFGTSSGTEVASR
ncbi:MAG TPA: hypothetical protein VK927_06815 [Adhaeribacter sp.]|nr:hypothetical protein [Adhaeribacter sp.]